MKRSVLVLVPVLALGMVSGAAFVVACGGGSDADAQTGGGAITRVVDANGTTLGTFLGAAPGWTADGLPSGEIFTFLTSGGRIWHVGAGGAVRQPEMDAFYSGAGCTGTVYLTFAAVQGVARAAGAFWTVASTNSVETPASYVPMGGTTGNCADWLGGAVTVRVATPIAALSLTPPLRIE